MSRNRLALIGLVTAAWLAAVGCSLSLPMPHIFGAGTYYQVTDEARGTVYYADRLEQQGRGVVEFRDGKSGAWISLPAAQVKEISEAEFRANTPK